MMFPAILLPAGLIVVGILLILTRRQFPRLIREGLTKFFGPAVAEEATDPRTTPISMVVVGICSIAFGAFNLVELLVRVSQGGA
ncbi:hypothetical protein [Microbacterium sp.]|uniref:hypothetical protein n=1 Tax=Microbacterium sp. TaxID=51671 RepID=UPI002736312A|nr:hypothetical protein [Microbacterium sp.]MDP3949739.1 hypothetical protein [Microbacterium sp.]